MEESTECSSKAGIAHLKLTSATFNQITQLADVIHMYNLHVASSSMSSLNAVTSSGDQLNETQPGLPYTVPECNKKTDWAKTAVVVAEDVGVE